MSKSVLLAIVNLLIICQGLKAQKTDSVASNGTYLYYHEYGAGAPVIVLSGGPGIDCRQIEPVAIALGKKYHAILLEQRGTGKSMPAKLDSTTINLDIAVNDINLLLDHFHLKSAAFCGHSWGSMLATYYASQFPDRVSRLLLVGPGPFDLSGEQWNTFISNTNTRLDLNELKELTDLIKKKQFTPAEFKHIREISVLERIYDKKKADTMMMLAGKAPLNPKTQELLIGDAFKRKINSSQSISNFKKPIDIICGRQDPLAFMAYEYKLTNTAVKIHWIQECGHFPMYEKPKEFYELLFDSLGK